MLRNATTKFITRIKAHDLNAWLLALLVFCLPFERVPSYEFHHLSLRPSLFVGGLLIIRFLWLLVAKRVKLRLNLPSKIIGAFLVWLILIVPAAINTTRAVQVTIYSFFVVGIFIAIYHMLKREYLPLIAAALFASATVVSLFGLFQYFGNYYGLSDHITAILPRYSWQVFGYPRIQSTGLEPLYFASYLLLPLTLIISFLTSKELGKRIYYPILLILSLNLFLTVSRGGNYAFVIFLVLLLPLLAVARQLRLRRIGLIILTILVAYGASLLIINKYNHPRVYSTGNGEGLSAYTNQITSLENSGDDRAISRQQAIDIIKRYPIIGVGPGNYGPYVMHNQPSADGWVIVNNEPLELWAETGAVGLLLVVLFGLALTIALVRVLVWAPNNIDRIWAVGLTGFLIAVVVQYQTFSTLYIVHIWTAFGLMMGLARLRADDKKKA